MKTNTNTSTNKRDWADKFADLCFLAAIVVPATRIVMTVCGFN